LEPTPSGFFGRRAAIRAGLAYALIVFVFAFALGAIRVTVVAPRLGALLAVILEGPIVLALGWRVSRWSTRCFHVPDDARARVLMGLAAFLCLMMLEVGFSLLVFGETLNQYVARNVTAPGLVGLAMQLGFAVIPWIQGRMQVVRPHG
jgi:hypothetical protein